MRHARAQTLALGLALALPLVGARPARAEDAPPPAAPALRPDQEEAVARAEALSTRMVELYGQGKYAEATALSREELGIREKALGKDHALLANALNNLALLLQVQGAYPESRALYGRALAIKERALGKLHPDVAVCLNNLAVLLQAEGDYPAALDAARRAIAIDERTLGANDPNLARHLSSLGAVLESQGALAQARPPLERALAILERALGVDHPDVATALGNLATLLQAQGAYDEARPLYERAVAVAEKALGAEHPAVALNLNNLATLLQMQGANDEARPIIERALAIDEQAFGADHPAVARDRSNLASILQGQGAFAEARPLFERSLAAFEATLGPDHPTVAQALNGLAGVLHLEHAYADARPFAERALAINERVLGKDHPAVALSLNNLGALYQAQGDFARARPLYERALAATEAAARTQLAALDTRQRLSLVRSTRHRLDNWLSLAPRLGLSGYAEVLRFRGVVARAEAAERSLSRRATGEDRRLQGVLQAAQSRAARLANEVPSSFQPEARAAWQRTYGAACAERERLTGELTKRVGAARTALERLGLRTADVQASLAPGTALVDVLRVGDSYLAWVVRATGEPVRVDLGDVEPMERDCAAFVAPLADGEDAAAAGAALRARVWAPLEAALAADVRRVVLCPDAALAAVPFAALPGKAPGTSLVDDFALAYVLQAQDLVVSKSPPPVGVGALVVGDVDYAHAASATSGSPAAARPTALAALDRAPRGEAFTPIPGTKAEAEALRTRFGKLPTTLLVGADATEARVRAGVQGKRYVHVATHGFAREDLRTGLRTHRAAEAWTSVEAERQLGAGHDPMLLAGLALAGANPRDGGGGDDGILTALEASYLDLDGVDLVTLSACETAKGTAESGEGVQGLVQAFQLAGARRVLASLWKVDDEATRLLMEGVYERLLRKDAPLAPADALREAARALRDRKGADGKARFAAPRYWAAFVAYGT